MKKNKKRYVYRIVNSEGECHQAFYKRKEAIKALKAMRIYRETI